MINWVHPGAILILGSLLIPFLAGRLKKAYMLALPVLAILSLVHFDYGVYGVYELFGQEITFGRVDRLAYAFAFIFALMSFIAMCYSLNYEGDGHHMAGFIYAGSAIGVAFAGDFITLFVFWEFMAFASVCLILYRRTPASYKAAYRYILVHVFGGVCLMGGAMLLYGETHSIAFNLVEVDGPAKALILIGFLINAAVPPFGAWLPDAYPEATIGGTVFLASFTTKSAVYALARGMAGTEILIWLGVFMAIYGVVYAVLENDIRRLLAYHIISQVGYMVAGVGIGTELAINGATAHAFAHILYKGLLFMGTGSVIYMTGRSKLTELGGVYRTMPITFMLYMVGGFAISSVPLFSGFVSKSVILSAAAEEHMMYAWLLLTLASAGTFLHTGLKLPYFTFMGRDAGIEGKEPPTNMIVGMALAAFMCIFIGVYPQFLYNLLPYHMDYAPYTPEHVVWTSQILILTWYGFYLYIKKLGGESTISVDTDWFYRKGGGIFLEFAEKVVARIDNFVSEIYRSVILAFGEWFSVKCWKFDAGVIDGIVNGVGKFAMGLGSALRTAQTGRVRDYAFGFMVGLLILINIVLFLF